MSTPPVVVRYLAAAETGDFVALADCFTNDGTVLDEGHTYTPRPIAVTLICSAHGR